MDLARQRQIASAVGACIARRRQDAGFTQEDAAARLEIGNEAVSRIERGVAAPTLGRLFEFADLYGCRVDELLLEASDRDTDQAAAIAHQIAGLSPADRQFVAGIVDQLTTHLRKRYAGRLKP